jgi:hypothetical protein
MPSEIAKIFELIGLGSPVLYCGAVFVFFSWLDKEASKEAKSAISDWLRPIDHDREAVATAIVELFDRIYTTPLLGWRAFRRSASISSVLTLILALEEHWGEFADFPFLHQVTFFGTGLITNILSDYLSLFFIRWWLSQKFSNAFVSLIVAAIGASLIVYTFFVFRVIAIQAIMVVIEDGLQSERLKLVWTLYFYWSIYGWQSYNTLMRSLTAAAIAVHLWLPLVAVSAVLIQVLNYFMRAVTFTEWFLEDGKERPVKAIGYVAAGVVLVATMVISILGRVLS